ncbi:MAG TPA: glycosyltransferase [Flavobacteriales bacterium]|nr:glycosyltransferase [Flavobacteriales bacterium]
MKVSVCTLTYNHVNYIKECIESALAQKTNFDFEICIGDDGSNDGTSLICADYARRYKNVKHILQDRKNIIYINGRATGRYNFISLLGMMQGQYIAMLDGDDYWTDSNKLQSIVNFLDHNRDFSFAFHSCSITENGTVRKDYLNQYTPDVIDLAYLARNGNCMRTMSVVFRNIYKQGVPEFFYHTPVGDYPFHIHNARHGKGKFIKKDMGVYRKHTAGIWSSYKSVEMKKEWLKMLEDISQHDSDPHILRQWREHMTEIAFSIGSILEKENDAEADSYYARAEAYAPDVCKKLREKPVQPANKSILKRIKKIITGSFRGNYQ